MSERETRLYEDLTTMTLHARDLENRIGRALEAIRTLASGTIIPAARLAAVEGILKGHTS